MSDSDDQKILVGTSGYSYADWVGRLYPEGTPKTKMLDYYAREFPTVEVNATYYRIPPPATFRAMEKKTPPAFQFVVKAHHDMTHARSLDAELYEAFAKAVEPLQAAGKFHGVIAQFPYAFRRSAANQEFLVELKRRLESSHAGDAPLFVEFRHASWVQMGAVDDVFEWLDAEGIAYVSVDEPDLPGLVPPIARVTRASVASGRTTDIGYVRFHGRNKENWWGAGEGGERWEKSRPGDPATTIVRGAPSRHETSADAPPRRSETGADYGPLFAADAPPPAPGPSGTSSDRYDYLYSEAELQEWVAKIKEMTMKAKKTFIFFNNCHVGQAATGAKLMRKLLEGEGLL